MPAHLVCLTNEGGVPLFTRSKGTAKPLAFAEQGMLYGVQMFAQNHGVSLQSTLTEDARIVWRVFHDSIILVLVQADDGGCDVHANTLLDHVFQTMVMFVGLESLTSIRNLERLRRELRVCYPVIDSFLDELKVFDSLTESVEVLVCPENVTLQDPLEAFITACDSTFGCLHSNGRLVVATPRWWGLSGQEMLLLSRLIRTLPKNSASDIPVYLPHASPKVPHRLLSVHLLSGLVTSVLCLANPTLEEVQSKLIESHWVTHFEALKSCHRSPPTNIPKSIPLDPGVLGFILVNTDQHKCVSSCQIPILEGSLAERRPLTEEKRRYILSGFYTNTVGVIFPVTHSPEREDSSGKLSGVETHPPLETYMSALDHKSYAIQSKGFQVFVLFSAAVPQHAIRSVTQNFLDVIMKEKIFMDLREKS